MFTGIIDYIGKVSYVQKKGTNLILTIEVNLTYLKNINSGNSISVNGVCLTVSNIKEREIQFFVSSETYKRTNLKYLKIGDYVNLEKALLLTSRLDGHIVQGHIDNIGTVISLYKQTEDYILKIKVPINLLKYIVEKGSISVNGVSLTVAKISGDTITISIIPETFKRTIFQYLKTGSQVNLEVDIISKYIEKLIRN